MKFGIYFRTSAFVIALCVCYYTTVIVRIAVRSTKSYSTFAEEQIIQRGVHSTDTLNVNGARLLDRKPDKIAKLKTNDSLIVDKTRILDTKPGEIQKSKTKDTLNVDNRRILDTNPDEKTKSETKDTLTIDNTRILDSKPDVIESSKTDQHATNVKPNCKLAYTKKYVHTKTTWPVPKINHSLPKQLVKLEKLNSTLYKSSLLLPRVISIQQHDDLVMLLQHLADLLSAMKVTFYMSDGGLLGSYVFHDMIPWDDDLDIHVDIQDRDRLLEVFADEGLRKQYGVMTLHDEIDLYEKQFLRIQHKMKSQTDDDILYETRQTISVNGSGKNVEHVLSNISSELAACRSYLKKKNFIKTMKFYFMSSKNAGNYKWKWPFIDVIFFDGNQTHIWPNDDQSMSLAQHRKIVFPITLRPLSHLWLPAPYDTHAFLQRKIKHKFECKAGAWDHANETGRGKRLSAKCNDLKEVYPYVKRQLASNGEIEENLCFGDSILHTVYVNQTYYPQSWFDL